jgi:predicted chitinase
MVGVNDGRFPVSFDLSWHGGMHLSAPMNGNVALEVRSIADGTVVYVRAPVKVENPDVGHAQMYRGHWTDNGVVVIRHDTEIGEGAQSKVSFFSVYMHLRHIESTVVRNRVIYRKAVIGNAGQIYGEQNRIHFEIISDDANLTKLVGRATGDLPLTANGRTDAVYGEMYFNVPAGTHLYGQRPPYNQPAPTTAATHTTTEALIVGLRYAGGDGVTADRGDAYLAAYQLNGTQLGAQINENEAEYKLYTTAQDISEAYPSTGRPATCAVYELLRFGRVLGPDALTPATVPNWREVRFSATAQGWINLNAANVHKFSDADFPHWKKWKLIHDDIDTNSRCDSATIKAWLDTDHDGHVNPNEAASRLGTAAIQEKLKKTICKFPTEWETATIAPRWHWLTTQSTENPQPMSGPDFDRLSRHIATLCFWQEANLQTQAIPAHGTTAAVAATPIPANHWHFEPREFIRHFRKCGWLELTELARTLPNRPGYSATGAVRTSLGIGLITLQTAKQRVANYVTPLNQTMRKYGISISRIRQAQFLAQVMLETDKWQVVREYGSGAPVARLPMIQYYAAFYGRGIMQLTWAGNYATYGVYRNFATHVNAYADIRITPTSSHYWGDPTLRNKKGEIIGLNPALPPRQWSPRYDPAIISQNSFHACDSGGHYWTSKHHDGHNDINRVADRDFSAASIGRVSVLVNGGGNGYYERQAYAQYAKRMLADSTATDVSIRFDAAKNGVQVDVNFTIPG